MNREEEIQKGTYDENKDRELIRLKKEDLWNFKKVITMTEEEKAIFDEYGTAYLYC